MRDSADYWFLAAIFLAVFVLLYWLRPARRATLHGQLGSLGGILLLAGVGIGLCLWSISLERSALTFERQASPIAIAIAFDLSPSMLAIPHPEFDSSTMPRFERGKTVLMEVFQALEERREPVIVSVIGFTKEGNIIMGWDQDAGQVRDILEYAVSPDLFGSAGTSIEAAAKSLRDVFTMLPEELQASSRRMAIIVSDGEDTMRASSFDYAQEELAEETFDTVALQTGLLDRNEGIPIYGSGGEFVRFRDMSGAVYTVPNAGAMNTIAAATAGRGLHLRAESPTAAQQLLEFAVEVDGNDSVADAALLSTFGMFAVVSMLCAVVIR